MFLMDTDLAKEAIVKADISKPIFAKYGNAEGRSINLYFLTFFSNEYIIAEIQWEDEPEEKYYIVDKEDIGKTIFPDEEYKKLLDEGVETLSEVVKLLKEANESK